MEFNKRIPIYLQISDLISYQIINGILKSGDPVPSVRDASSKYAVNPNTVLNAYKELEMRGLIYTKRGIGFFITEDKEVIESLKNNKLKKSVDEFLDKIHKMGYSDYELKNILVERGKINE